MVLFGVHLSQMSHWCCANAYGVANITLVLGHMFMFVIVLPEAEGEPLVS